MARPTCGRRQTHWRGTLTRRRPWPTVTSRTACVAWAKCGPPTMPTTLPAAGPPAWQQFAYQLDCDGTRGSGLPRRRLALQRESPAPGRYHLWCRRGAGARYGRTHRARPRRPPQGARRRRRVDRIRRDQQQQRLYFIGIALAAMCYSATDRLADAIADCDRFLSRWHESHGPPGRTIELCEIAPTLARADRLDDVHAAALHLPQGSHWREALFLLAEGRYADTATRYEQIGSEPLAPTRTYSPPTRHITSANASRFRSMPKR